MFVPQCERDEEAVDPAEEGEQPDPHDQQRGLAAEFAGGPEPETDADESADHPEPPESRSVGEHDDQVHDPDERNMNAVIWAMAMNVSLGWMNEKIRQDEQHSEDRVQRLPPPAAHDCDESKLERPGDQEDDTGQNAIDLAELRLNRNMISDRISQSVPVIRKIHHQLP